MTAAFVVAAFALLLVLAWGRHWSLEAAIEPVRRIAGLSASLYLSNLPTLLFLLALAVVLILWLLPKWQASRSEGMTAANGFDRENEARKTLAQIIGGLFVLAGLYSSIQTFNLQRQTESLQEQGQITDRFTKAIDQLGAVAPGGGLDVNGKPKPNLEVRLGGIYALERIAQDSPQRDHWTIMEILTAYVRENAPMRGLKIASAAKDKHLRIQVRADIQAALTVIGRRDIARDPKGRTLDLSHTDLSGADLYGAHMERAVLTKVGLEDAGLLGSYLNDALLLGADLRGADLIAAHLNGTILSGADLRRASLTGADLGYAYLGEAYLGKEYLGGADLRGTNLSEARGLVNGQLDHAKGDAVTKVPSGLHPPWWWSH